MAAAGCAQTPPLPALGMTTCSGFDSGAAAAGLEPLHPPPQSGSQAPPPPAASKPGRPHALGLSSSSMLVDTCESRQIVDSCVSFYSYVT